MSEELNIKVQQMKKGPNLRLSLTIFHYDLGEAETPVYVIDGLAEVSLKLRAVRSGILRNIVINMFGKKHELAKNDAITINVVFQCGINLVLTNYDLTNDWKCIYSEGVESLYLGEKYRGLHYSMAEIIISAHSVTKPPFPKLYEDCDMTDFTLSTADGKVAVHKACLAAHSPVFKTMFSGKWKETEDNLIEMKDYTLQTIQHLKDYLYLGTLPDVGLRPLITLAALYSINDLTKECARRLVETVEPEGLYALHEFACANNIPELSYALSLHVQDDVVDQSYEIKTKMNKNPTKLNYKNNNKPKEGQ